MQLISTPGYRAERELGSGAMATVYLAEDLKHHRNVAIRVLHPELSAVLGPERFLKEIEVTANLQHPHILPLFDSGSADRLLYYVMPFVEGETLRSRLEREQQLPVSDAAQIATEVDDALAYAHDRGVIHRDIKPENILVQDGHALAADCGIALAVQQAGGTRLRLACRWGAQVRPLARLPPIRQTRTQPVGPFATCCFRLSRNGCTMAGAALPFVRSCLATLACVPPRSESTSAAYAFLFAA